MNAQAQIEPFSLYELPRFSVRSRMAATKKAKTTKTSPQKRSAADNPTPDFSALLYDIGKNKNRQAFITLFEYFAPRVKSFLISSGLSHELADEIAQETMLTVWHKAKGYNPSKAKASTWIFTIARNKKIDHFRKYSRENIVDLELGLLQDDSASPSQNTQEIQEEQIIAHALQELPDDQADLIHKSFFEGKSHSEIAKETKIPLGTIKSRIRLALERLRGVKDIKDLK